MRKATCGTAWRHLWKTQRQQWDQRELDNELWKMRVINGAAAVASSVLKGLGCQGRKVTFLITFLPFTSTMTTFKVCFGILLHFWGCNNFFLGVAINFRCLCKKWLSHFPINMMRNLSVILNIQGFSYGHFLLQLYQNINVNWWEHHITIILSLRMDLSWIPLITGKLPKKLKQIEAR